MTGRKKEDYDAVWKAIREINPDFNPKEVTANYEPALRGSLRKFFIGINIVGCLFHFAQVNAVYVCKFKRNLKFHNCTYKFSKSILIEIKRKIKEIKAILKFEKFYNEKCSLKFFVKLYPCAIEKLFSQLRIKKF